MTNTYGQQILGSAEYDGVTNALDNYDVAGKVLGDGVHLFSSGPNGCTIDEIVFIALDLTFTDPAADHQIGYAVDYTINGGGAYTSIITTTAAADLPTIWDDTGNDTEDFALGVPVYPFGFLLATPANSAGARTYAVPASALVRVRIGSYVAGSLTALTTLDNFIVQVEGRFS
jgi:hypothetical protein